MVKQVTPFRFSYRGFVVKFTSIPRKSGKDQFYSFSIIEEEELTQQVLDAVKTKKVKKEQFLDCTEGVVNKIIEIQTGVNPSKTKRNKVNVWFEVIKPGGPNSFWQIRLAHHRGVLRKNFIIETENKPVSARSAWYSIWSLGYAKEYGSFLLENFNTEVRFNIKKMDKQTIRNFSTNCFKFEKN